MTDLYLFRTETSDEGTLGLLWSGRTLVRSIEPPWRFNRRNISCIPAGVYVTVPYKSPTFGQCFLLEDVPNRSAILIHHGNWAGDKSQGMRCDSDGCILVGMKHGQLHDQQCVLDSRVAMQELRDMFTEPFALHVVEGTWLSN